MATETEFRIAVIEALDVILGANRAFTDRTSGATPFPHAVVDWGISIAPGLEGDSRTLALRDQFQVDLREKAKDEDPDLWRTLVSVFNGVRLAGHRCSVLSCPRQMDPTDKAVVRHIFTIQRPIIDP